MDLRYDLTEDDITEATAQLMHARHWSGLDDGSRVWRLALVLALLLPPVYLLVLRRPLTALASPDHLLVLGTALCAALLLSYLFVPLAPRRLLRRRGWQLKVTQRAARRGVQRSVLGPVTLRVDEAGLVRTNARGDVLHLPWPHVRDFLAAPGIFTLRLKDDDARVVVAPARAFPDVAQAEAFAARVEAATGRPRVPAGFDVPPPPAPPLRAWLARQRLPLLSLGLALVLCLFGLLTLLPWLRDPTRTNPPGAVVLYSAEWCGICDRLRACLQQSGVPFDERDVERSAQAEREWSALGATGVPVVLVGPEVVHGWNDALLRPLLAQAGHRLDCGRTPGRAAPTQRP